MGFCVRDGNKSFGKDDNQNGITCKGILLTLIRKENSSPKSKRFLLVSTINGQTKNLHAKIK